MGYGIHIEEVEKTEKDCECPVCTLGNASHAKYMKTLASTTMVAEMLRAAPGIELIELGAHGFEWFMDNRRLLRVPDGLALIVFITMARAFSTALMDTAAKIREEKS